MLRQTFGQDKRWLNWKLETVNGDLTKVPYNPNNKHKASSTNSETWGTYDQAKSISDKVGIILHDKQLICIDIDHCMENGKIVHPMKKEIEDFIKLSDSYTEISQSNTGLHIFMIITEPYHVIAKKHEPWEIYSWGRFIAVTENIYENREQIRTVTIDEMTSILETTGYPWGKTEEVIIPKLNYSISTSLTDQEVLDIMFNAKNGSKVSQLYNATGSKGSSEDDMSLCTHLAFYCDGYDQIERIWVSSPLGSRLKTTKREDYRKVTINKAMSSCTDHYSPQLHTTQTKKFIEDMKDEEHDITEYLVNTVDSKGNRHYIMNTENVCRMLRQHPKFKNRLRYDDFVNHYQIDSFGYGAWVAMEDNEAVNIQTQLSVLFPPFAKIGKEMVHDAMYKVAKENRMDSAVQYVKSLEWDRTARLDTWLCKAFGADDDDYHHKVGANWMKGMIKRIIYPGSKFDYVLVLEGPQGAKKSSALSELCKMPNNTNWHLETTMSTDTKDFFMQMSGKTVVEFSEGDTLSKTETKKLKAIITTQSDKYRLPYERVSKEFPRRCVFAMTTNESEYLKDATGNRRWLPVEVKFEESDIKWIEENRDQLFAEAYYRAINLKETTYEFPKALLEERQQERNIKYVYEDVIVDWYEELSEYNRSLGVSTRDIFINVIHKKNSFPPAITQFDQTMIGTVLSRMGLIKDRKMKNGIKTYKYFSKVKVEVEKPKPAYEGFEGEDIAKELLDTNKF